MKLSKFLLCKYGNFSVKLHIIICCAHLFGNVVQVYVSIRLVLRPKLQRSLGLLPVPLVEFPATLDLVSHEIRLGDVDLDGLAGLPLLGTQELDVALVLLERELGVVAEAVLQDLDIAGDPLEDLIQKLKKRNFNCSLRF